MPYGVAEGAPVVVDTSAWIEYLRWSPHALRPRVDVLMKAHQARLSWVAAGELLRGVRDAHELAAVEELIGTVPILAERPVLWGEAGRLSNRLRRAGHAVDLVDCYLGVLACEHGAGLLTGDRHFEAIAFDLKLVVEIL